MAEPDDAAALDRFRAFYLHFLTEAMRDGGSYTTKVNIRALPAAMQERVELRRNALRDHIAGLLETAVAEGSVRPLDCLATANYLVMAINWLVAHPGEFPTPSQDAEQEARTFLDQVLYGIATGAGGS
ncbi:MAG: hypothetical protein GYB53_03975 [Rhodobacteraceae bacterium]|nr:hypothetical protein [Paracoccaceae bacterium]